MGWIILAFLIVLVYVLFDWLLKSLRVRDYGAKYVLITGCDSGFGKTLAMKLDKLGFYVFAGCFTKDGEAALKVNGTKKLKPVQLDVCSTDSIKQCFLSIKETLPADQGLWALVNNAGIAGELGPPDLNTVEGVRKTLDVNLYGPIAMCHQFLPLIKRSKGRIINMTSMCGRFPAAEGPYSASKYGLEGFSDILRRELFHQGIKVCILEPNYFKTDILKCESSVRDVIERMTNAQPEVKAAYGDSFHEKYSLKVENMIAQAAPNINPVINAYLHAITARFPCKRYVIGYKAKFVIIPLSFMPDCVLNVIVPIFMKLLSNKRLKF